MYTQQLPGLLFRRFNRCYTQNRNRLASFFGQCENYKKFHDYRKRLNFWLRCQSAQLTQVCARQFEFVAAQRVRRSLQIFHLYSRIWDEMALKEFIKSWRRRTLKNTRYFLMSSVGVTMYNWDRERIRDEELNSYKQEIEGIHRLKDTTVVCSKCQLRIVVDNEQPSVKYCTCHDSKINTDANRELNGWMPFMECKDMLIWRREEPDSGGLFAYKVYGSFADVSAEDFLQVQIDVDYRKEWDPTAQELQIVDTDPKLKSSVDHSNDIIYWEMIWPRLFANRDYVYQRRWVVDKEKGLIVIISRVTEHPDVPIRPGIYRVTTYWSYMVIRPYTEFHQPGIEFGLTYFDDPGVNVPSTVTTWVAMSGLPNFLIRMREASKNYKKYKTTKQGAIISDTNYEIFKENILQEKIVDIDDGISEKTEISTKSETVAERGVDRDDVTKFTTESEESDESDESEESEESEEESNINEASKKKKTSKNSTSERDRGFLYHLFLTKLFA